MQDNQISDQDAKAFVERVAASEAFIAKKGLREFLQFLLERRQEILTAAQLAELFFKRFHKGGEYNVDQPRERASTLRTVLKEYEAANLDDPIRGELPNANEIGGYQLRLVRITEGVSACRRFWEAHLDSGKDTVVVCDPLLFFWDDDESMMLRLVDTNIDGVSRTTALAELKRLHKKRHKETLIPGHLYIDVGSVAAAELIREHFRSAGVHLPLMMDKQANRKWLKSSPVVIGNVRTSEPLKKLFRSADTKGLAYRLDETRYCGIHIKEPRREEINAVKAIGATIDAEGKFITSSTELTIGTVTRMPNPVGTGVMTIISSDGTYTTKQMATTLTTESQLRLIFTQMGWLLDQPVPDTFEMMFLVRLWPGDMDEETKDAELLFGRP
jgi:hypothetical protein